MNPPPPQVALPNSTTWISTIDLLYPNNNTSKPNTTSRCANCGTIPPSLLRCKKCTTTYCNMQCYRKDWRGKPHSAECDLIAMFFVHHVPRPRCGETLTHAQQVIEKKIQIMISYLSAFAATHGKLKGRNGLLLLQGNCSVEDMIFVGNMDWRGMRLHRAFHVTFLTLDEWDSLLMERNFELGHEASKTIAAVQERGQDEMVVCVLLTCGFLSTGIVQMVPKSRAAERLGAAYEFESKEELVLDIDARDADDDSLVTGS